MKLTQKQKDALAKHKIHHTKAHMAQMKTAMRKGHSFAQAHKTAMAKVGK